MESVKNGLARVLTHGEIFVINVDDTEHKYEEIYDPDLREFYHPERFPSQIFNLEDLKRREVYEKIISGTGDWLANELSKPFHIILWSKYKIDEELETKKIIEKFERRFSSILPVPKLDLLLLSDESAQSST
eukprot:TRINITY_DN2707_c0_g1_i28.p1 TRINITY_DN2707_c0_g1~~TRINITY_DN2707_c0_g1_i28.p1  ORF type:complete len:132 (-),score=50.59 TRINITY_DN2707_c0_g1_i28:262-657(-)